MSGPHVYLQDPDVTLWCGDVLDTLRQLPDESAHMACTSPPFYGLRDYGTEGQIGLEATPDLWVARLVSVFREVRRVLRADGTLWVEIGDSYCANDAGVGRPNEGHVPNAWQHRDVDIRTKGAAPLTPMKHPTKPKDLLGQPWLLALALRADGWFLRSEIIWAKPNPMPESVTDRPTVSHSRVFLLAKSPRYFYDAEAIREPAEYGRREWSDTEGNLASAGGGRGHATVSGSDPAAGRNRRTIWTIPTEPYPDAHFATWPQKLVEPIILAGTSERGVCPECGKPWERIVSESYDTEGRTTNGQKPKTAERRGFDVRKVKSTSTEGWQSTCAHSLEPVPAVVLDPFAGSGTTLHVARRLGRRSVGIELNPGYCQLAANRLAQQSLLAHETGRP